MNDYFEKYLGEIEKAKGKGMRLLLHSCCAPCSTRCVEELSKYFSLDVFYYNPCIFPEEEYIKRLNEEKRFLSLAYPQVGLIEVGYDHDEYTLCVSGLENEREGGTRCYKCYEERLKRTYEYAKASGGYDYFTTTLSVSPYKNAVWLNEIGEKLGSCGGVKYLYADFKKKEGYKRSIELSKQYDLYRQHYCGCEFSLINSEVNKNTKV